uniref:(northern house mosquito) hypothetical protein n=1 Tax=Culex pipiens TaxID=7175 RepID=A0A8D8B4A2_CULPI
MRSLYALATVVLVCLQLELCKSDWPWCNCPVESIKDLLDGAIRKSGMNQNGIPSDCVQRTTHVLSQLEADARKFERDLEDLRKLEDEIYSRGTEVSGQDSSSTLRLDRLIEFYEKRDLKKNQDILAGEGEEIECIKLQLALEEELQDMNRTDGQDKMKLDDLKRQIHEITKKNKALELRLQGSKPVEKLRTNERNQDPTEDES